MDGLQAGLKRRHVTMIALGGVIGAGLFVGSGAVINQTGPAAVLSYLIAGILPGGLPRRRVRQLGRVEALPARAVRPRGHDRVREAPDPIGPPPRPRGGAEEHAGADRSGVRLRDPRGVRPLPGVRDRGVSPRSAPGYRFDTC